MKRENAKKFGVKKLTNFTPHMVYISLSLQTTFEQYHIFLQEKKVRGKKRHFNFYIQASHLIS